MPIADFILSSVQFASPPLGLPSLTIPLTAAILTPTQETNWDSIYGASVDVVSLSPSTWADALTALGVTTGEDIQVALADMFSQVFQGQQSAPDEFLLARRSTPVAQVVTVTINGNTDGTFTHTINGTDHAFVAVAQTTTQIRDGLVAAINAGSEPVTAAPGAGDTYTVTADEAGVPFTSSVTSTGVPADITQATTTPNTGLPEDIANWDSQDARWTFLLETTRSSGNIQAAAETIETIPRKPIFVAQTNDPLAQSGASTDDLASVLGSAGLGLTRTALVWHDNDDQFVDFALVGKMMGFLPGDPNWVHQSLASVTGIEAPVLTSTTTLEQKRYTFLEQYGAPVPPVSSTRGGKMLDGNWIDIVHLVMDLNLRVQIREYEALRDGNVPYFGGKPTVKASLEGALNERAGPPGQAALVEGSISSNVPDEADQADVDRLARTMAGVTWTAQAQGKTNIVINVGYLEQ